MLELALSFPHEQPQKRRHTWRLPRDCLTHPFAHPLQQNHTAPPKTSPNPKYNCHDPATLSDLHLSLGQFFYFLRMIRFSEKIQKYIFGSNFSAQKPTRLSHLLSFASLFVINWWADRNKTLVLIRMMMRKEMMMKNLSPLNFAPPPITRRMGSAA